MKRILGLDLGTNSIGWALIEMLNDGTKRIIKLGSRIIPMSKAVIKDFEKGVTKSQTAQRTDDRGTRRLYERSNTRRERLHRVLNVLGYLPTSYSKYIDFDKNKGQFKNGVEPLLAYSDELDEDGKRKFLFLDSYEEMEKEFREIHPNLPKYNKKGKSYKIPYDWTLYYLRKKGLTQKISDQELAWILLNFNQKRGYYQERNEKEVKVDENKEIKYELLKAEQFIKTEETVEDKPLYKIIFANGWEYDKTTTKPEIWKGINKEFIVTTTINKDGSFKRTFKKVDSESDWEAIKRKTEQDLRESNDDNGRAFVGKYIYESMLKKPYQKVRGELIRTIDRDFYFDELEVILRTQRNYREEEWNDPDLFKKAVQELYPHNHSHQENLLNQKDTFIHLFLLDILFYHRPLKSQKGLISKCSFESRAYCDKETGISKKAAINGMPKSHPLFQEFRVWQLVHNIRIQKREQDITGKLHLNIDVTDEYLQTHEDFSNFFEFLYNKKELSQKQLVACFIKDKKEQSKYRWNFSDDDKIKLDCNQTRPLLLSKFSNKDKDKFTKTTELKLWHIIYSVTDKKQYTTAINRFVHNNKLSEETKEKLQRAPMLKKEYASYSEKAVKKLLGLMRMGKFWDKDSIDNKTLERIDKLLTGEFDEKIENRVREKSIHLNEVSDFQGLPLWLASYIVYGKHSEVDATQWKTSKDLDNYIKNFKQHSLRNPIVEQVLLESLRVTLDVWKQFGEGCKVGFEEYIDEETKKPKKSYNRLFDEIHIEIGRDLKNPKRVRERISDSINKNKDVNQRVRKLLFELKNFKDVEEVRPKSRTHFDKLKIFEQTVLSNYSEKELKQEKLDARLTVEKFIKKDQPTSNEILKYKLWLEQKYVSPYTSQIIPLTQLFTSKYEIEHVIPQSKYLDNSFNNKIICEAEVNTLKDNRTAYAFIQEYQEMEVPLSGGGSVTISKQDVYERFVKNNYEGRKQENLLRESIPKKMNERQKTDMRYISKAALKMFSNIVREEGENESTVKNMIPVSGGVTAKLRAEWGLNAVWSKLVEDRFKRLNTLICGEENRKNGLFGSVKKDGNFFKPEVPLELREDFELKRIDHRHHALDAVVIACATRSHVNYINNEHAKPDLKRYDLGKTLRNTKEIEKINPITKEKTKQTVLADYKKPWKTFTEDTKEELQKTVISFQQNLRAINKAQNYNWRYKDNNGTMVFDKNGKPKKQWVEQVSFKTDKNSKNRTNWAIRKPLHEETVFGTLENGEFKGDLVKREPLNTSFTEKKIRDVVDKTTRNILLSHLKEERYKHQTDESGNELKPHEVAFSARGLKELNENILRLNNGIFHHSIKKVRLRFAKGKQFSIKKWEDKNGNLVRETKFVKSASGTNLYFCIYEKGGDRKYYVPPFEEILTTQKLEQDLPFAEKKNVPSKHPDFPDYNLKFYLQPNDLVYMPTEEDEEVDFSSLSKEQLKRIYLFKDGSGTTANFIPMYSADVIYNLGGNKAMDRKRKEFAEIYGLDFDDLIKNEYGLGSPQLKNQNTIDGIQVKFVCWKLQVDRLGNVLKVFK
ncbi:MAG: type II CRISPR RNA-guided endonuclease Cas9 [Bacteroidota bacterium]